MNILVIGNGFDLAHGLPTKYSDFLHFVEGFLKYNQTIAEPDLIVDDKDRRFFGYFEELSQKHPNVYDELKGLTKDNRWIDYFMSILDRQEKDGKDGWIDFESEISKIIQILDECRLSLDEQFKSGSPAAEISAWHSQCLEPLFFNEMNTLIFRGCVDPTFFQSCKRRSLVDLNQLIRCLEIYLSDYVQSIPVSPLRDIEVMRIDRVLSFNYTNTAERLYRGRYGQIYNIDYNYIHGKAEINSNVEKCNMVLGIDEYLPDQRKDDDNEFVEFKKFYQRIYKATGSHYIDWIEEHRTKYEYYTRMVEVCEEDGRKYKEAMRKYERVKRILFFKKKPYKPKYILPDHDYVKMYVDIYGHSLDVTDKDILRRLILEDGAVTTIYYYDKKDLGNKIANLVKVIGEDELIRRTDGRHATIIFKETTKENGA